MYCPIRVLDCDDAQVWVSDAGPVKFAWEIARANATGRAPDLGQHNEEIYCGLLGLSAADLSALVEAEVI